MCQHTASSSRMKVHCHTLSPGCIPGCSPGHQAAFHLHSWRHKFNTLALACTAQSKTSGASVDLPTGSLGLHGHRDDIIWSGHGQTPEVPMLDGLPPALSAKVLSHRVDVPSSQASSHSPVVGAPQLGGGRASATSERLLRQVGGPGEYASGAACLTCLM